MRFNNSALNNDIWGVLLEQTSNYESYNHKVHKDIKPKWEMTPQGFEDEENPKIN